MDTKDRIPKKTVDLLERDIEGEIVVMSPAGNVLHTFEGSALFIWKMMDGARTMEQIAALMTEEYLVEAEAARSDLETFMAELQKLSLVHLE